MRPFKKLSKRERETGEKAEGRRRERKGVKEKERQIFLRQRDRV
jgi:hypothetical protein